MRLKLLIDTNKLAVKRLMSGPSSDIAADIYVSPHGQADLYELTDSDKAVFTEVRIVEESMLYETEPHPAIAKAGGAYDFAQVETVAFVCHDFAPHRMAGGRLESDKFADADGFVGELGAQIAWAITLADIAQPYWESDHADFMTTVEGFVERLVSFMSASGQWPEPNVVRRDAVGALFDAFDPAYREELLARQLYRGSDDASELVEPPASDTGEEHREDDDEFAQTQWSVDDVKSVRPHWTSSEAREWLQDNERTMRDRLVELGWEVMEALLPVGPESERDYPKK